MQLPPLPFIATLLLSAAAMAESPDAPAPPPLSAAQNALFGTPHLKNISQPETIEYRFERTGIEPFVDKIAIHVSKIHPDGTKYVSFDFLTGTHNTFYPAVDDFSGNPLLMVFLEHDVQQMKTQFGVAATYFRDRIRDGFVDKATVSDTTVDIGGKSLPAKQIALKPFVGNERLEQLPAVQQKEYDFILCDAVPGQIAGITTRMPADPTTHAPAWAEQITYTGEQP